MMEDTRHFQFSDTALAEVNQWLHDFSQEIESSSCLATRMRFIHPKSILDISWPSLWQGFSMYEWKQLDSMWLTLHMSGTSTSNSLSFDIDAHRAGICVVKWESV